MLFPSDRRRTPFGSCGASPCTSHARTRCRNTFSCTDSRGHDEATLWTFTHRATREHAKCGERRDELP